jgi:uncharacterized membrane protein
LIRAGPAARIQAIPGVAWVALAAVLFAALYWVLDLNKLHALEYQLDNGIFLQSLAHAAKDGSAFNWAERDSHWYVHDSWLLLVLVPFVKLYPYQETIVLAQILVVAGASIVLYLFARAIGVDRTPAALLAVAYLISPSVQGFAYADFSESHFEPLLIFALAIAVARRSFWGTLVCAQALMGIKEDLGLFLIWFGAAGAIWYDRRLGTSVALLAVANTVAYYFIVALHGAHPVSPPFYALPAYPVQDLAFMLEVLAPFAFAPLLLGWRVLLALPLLIELFWANYAHGPYPLARAGVHYTEALIGLIAVGAAVGIRKRPNFAKWSLVCACFMALFFNTTVLHFGRHVYKSKWTDYERARSVVVSQKPIQFDPSTLGQWAAAAGDLNAREWYYNPITGWSRSK